MASGWTSLERPSTRCADCEARLADQAAPGDPAYATLRIEAGQLVREDLCPTCFGARKPRPATFWKRRVRGGDPEQAKAKSPKRQQTERLLELFDTLAASLEPGKQPTEPAVAEPAIAATQPETAASPGTEPGTGVTVPDPVVAEPAVAEPAV
ncbi:MAG: hypothetical protein ACYTFT_04030, partial [Planctomycetota bacterium]